MSPQRKKQMQMKLLKIQYVYFHNFYWCRSMKINWTTLYACPIISWSFFILKCSQEEESAQQVGRKRAAPRGRGRGRGSTAKRGRKTDIASIQSMMSKDDDDSEDEPPKKAPPRVREYRLSVLSSHIVAIVLRYIWKQTYCVKWVCLLRFVFGLSQVTRNYGAVRRRWPLRKFLLMRV